MARPTNATRVLRLLEAAGGMLPLATIRETFGGNIDSHLLDMVSAGSVRITMSTKGDTSVVKVS